MNFDQVALEANKSRNYVPYLVINLKYSKKSKKNYKKIIKKV